MPARGAAPADFPARNDDFRVVGLFVNDFTGEADRHVRLVLEHHTGYAGDPAVRLMAIVQFDDSDQIGDSADESPKNRLSHNDVAVDHALTGSLEPADIHRSAFATSGNRRRKPFMPALVALP